MKGDRNGFRCHDKTHSITHCLGFIGGWGLLLALLLTGGCSGSGKTKYFTLYPMSWLTPEYESAQWDASIGIGPVTIAEYIDRFQIVRRLSRNEVAVSDLNLWAESLETSIPKVISENISTLLSSEQVYTYPWDGHSPDYQVRIDILQFDGNMPGNVVFIARWSLFKNGVETTISNRKFFTRKPIAGQGYEGLVSTMSLVLYDLSNNIAETLNSHLQTHEGV